MKTINKTKFAISASLMTGLVTGCASDSNLFGQKELSSGYMNEAKSAKDQATQKAKDGTCGEGKCGADMQASEEKKAAEAAKKVMEGKCGEGKCGAEH